MNVQDLYNKTAGSYDSRYSDTQTDKYRIMLGGISLDGKILDLGCGTGLLAEFLRLPLHGVDNSEEMLVQAQRRGVKTKLADMQDLPYKDKEFDFVLSFSSLMNVKNPEKAIKEAKRVLKDDGVFICTYLRHFEDKLKPMLERHFTVKERVPCGEDVGFILDANK